MKDDETADFPIVGIGASAGGLDAYKNLLRSLPTDTGAAFVLVQHLDPNHESLMADLLARHTRMQVAHSAHRAIGPFQLLLPLLSKIA